MSIECSDSHAWSICKAAYPTWATAACSGLPWASYRRPYSCLVLAPAAPPMISYLSASRASACTIGSVTTIYRTKLPSPRPGFCSTVTGEDRSSICSTAIPLIMCSSAANSSQSASEYTATAWSDSGHLLTAGLSASGPSQVALHGGDTIPKTRPTTAVRGTGPYDLESFEFVGLSPSSQTCPGGTLVATPILVTTTSPSNATARLQTVLLAESPDGFCAMTISLRRMLLRPPGS